MGGQIAFFTGSRIAEEKMLGSIDEIIDAGVSIESRILPTKCSQYELEEHVIDSLADVFVIGSSRPTTLCSYVASCTNRPIIGVPLSEVDDELSLYNLKETPMGGGFATVPIDDVECAIKLALQALQNSKAT